MATADPDFNVRVAQKSKFASFDPGQDLLRYTPEQLEIILANIDILFSNNHEMDRMCDMLGTGREALVASVPMTVTTRGAEGSILCMDGEEHHVPAVTVAVPVSAPGPITASGGA
jgi:ribokinase